MVALNGSSNYVHNAYETRLFINGEYVSSNSPERITCLSPLDDTVVTDDVHVAGQQDVDAAVAAARAALKSWREVHPMRRSALLHKLADLVEAHVDELARLESLCTGKSVAAFKSFEIPLAANTCRYYAGWCDKLEGESFPPDGGFMKVIRHEPLGVCAAVNAFNGPTVMVLFKAAPAIAAGNAVVMKASEKSPLSTIYFGKIFNEAGFPPGVFNVVNGAGATGSLLASHMDIDKISFTGSVSTGKRIAEAAAKSNLKRVTLELGGKSPSIVFPDANLDVAVQWCTTGITVNCGQACIASSRVYVHEDVKEQFVNRMKTAFEGLYGDFGDPNKETTSNSPLVDKMQFERVMQFIKAGKSEATLMTGGDALFEKGTWVKPTIFMDSQPDASIYKQEIFGPIVVINSFKDEDEVIDRANDTVFGLSGAVFSQDINRAMRVAGRIHSGTVGVNCCTMVDYTVPFGGYKQSGAGRELGKYGIKAYTEPKTIFINLTY